MQHLKTIPKLSKRKNVQVLRSGYRAALSSKGEHEAEVAAVASLKGLMVVEDVLPRIEKWGRAKGKVEFIKEKSI